jgi:YVTN family beta-propeller protein
MSFEQRSIPGFRFAAIGAGIIVLAGIGITASVGAQAKREDFPRKRPTQNGAAIGLSKDETARLFQAGGSAAFSDRIADKGVVVDFSINPLADASSTASAGLLREGDDVCFRFKMTDATTGNPVTGAYPAAWMDLRPAGATAINRSCSDRVQQLLGGSIFAKAELDLNVYYVLAMNDDASVSVVDPLFGYGGSKLLAMVALKSPAEDWVISADQSKLFVSMPDSNRIAVIDTNTWKLVSDVEVGPNPRRLALQPDGRYLWVATDSGVTVFDSVRLESVTRIQTGAGDHQIALSNDNRFAFVTNRPDGTVSIIELRSLKKLRQVEVGREPGSIAISDLSRMVYVSSSQSGTITVIDGEKHEVLTRVKAEPGLGQIKFAPGGRLGFVVNPERDLVHILDAASNRIVQTGDLEDGPDQIAFSNELAYIRHRGSEIVLMIPLKESGIEGRPVKVVDFPGGEHAFGKGRRPSSADSIVQAPGANAVLVANPADRSIYFYKEGMAAPMGNFKNYSRQPRAVLVLDKSLRERAPGIYETTAKLRRPGLYDVAVLVNTPRIVHCFQVSVGRNPDLPNENDEPRVEIQPLIENKIVTVGEPLRLRFKLTAPETKQPLPDVKDVQVLAFLAPGVWHKRQTASHSSDGVYEVHFTFPRAGIYYVYLESRSLGLSLANPQYLILQAVAREARELK